MASVSTAGNAISAGYYLCWHDFGIFKRFKVIIRPPRAPNIVDIFWQPPPSEGIKLNYDGALTSPLGVSVCGGIARDNDRDNDGSFLGAFASF